MLLGDNMKLSEMSKQGTTSQGSNKKSFSENQQKNIQETYNKLKDCSGDELMQRLAKEVQTQKSNGTFDYDALINSIEKIKIYLPTQTYQNMIRIIENLR